MAAKMAATTANGSFGGFARVELAKLDLAEGAARAEGGDAERNGQFDFSGPHADLFALGIEVDDLLVVEPRLDLLRGDSGADFVPATGVELDEFGGLVFGSVVTIDAREADERTAPTAEDDGEIRSAVGQGEAAKEIGPFEAGGFEGDFVVRLGSFAREVHSGDVAADPEDQRALLDFD